ncbi:16S rRNA (guanine(527)-N(7))-methyltransferase RsmG [Anaerostipes faecalis]|uniref:16S rRNA (guanine(527)-N(7))-methyltransferase RsmG n=1 Tax=Anaerostipes faecalis TaxID=2738446 RepID=UPI003F12A2E7
MERLKQKALDMGIALTDDQIFQFEKYYEMLIEKNKVMNLTAITEKEEVIDKHFVDSLAFVKMKFDLSGKKMLDLGTGAGFPGIPLKIAFPELDIVLIDSLNKRVRFLNEVIEELSLEKISAIHGRAEDFAKQKDYRESFDFVVSRAVANLAVLSEYCIPYAKENGYFCPYKSGEIQDEVKNAEKAISVLGGKLEDIISFEIPNTDMKRTILKIKKRKATPKRFPRKAGLPSKEPIC